MQFFGVYIVIISQKEPRWTTDLLGYQLLIIDASQIGSEGGWLVYHQHFYLKASALGLKDWSSAALIATCTVVTPNNGQEDMSGLE